MSEGGKGEQWHVQSVHPSVVAGGASLLVHFGMEAESDFRLVVTECNAPGAPVRWGPVHQVHARGSLHYVGRAADAHGSTQDMERFGQFMLKNHTPQLAELIHNPGCSVKDGRQVDPSFWGPEVWAQHANHVHFAV
jgi:hypothetical protein